MVAVASWVTGGMVSSAVCDWEDIIAVTTMPNTRTVNMIPPITVDRKDRLFSSTGYHLSLTYF
jgi:hypothetical protein